MEKNNINIKWEDVLKDTSYRLIDVRTEEEILSEPINANCSCIVMDKLLEHPHLIDNTEKVIFICAAGIRSRYVAEFFRAQGNHTAYSLVGGVSDINNYEQ